MKKKLDIRKKIWKDLYSKFYSLGFLIGLGVQHPYFGKGSIVRVGGRSDSCTIKFDPYGIRVSMFVGTLLDANSDWQLDLDLLEKIYTTFSDNVDTRRIERDELDERLSQLESELKILDTRGTLTDGSISRKSNAVQCRLEDIIECEQRNAQAADAK